MSTNKETELQAAVRGVLRRASFDPEFRKLAVRDAAAALAWVAAGPLPPDVRFRFADNSGSTKTVILPDLQSEEDELSNEQLGRVAGGCDIASYMLTN